MDGFEMEWRNPAYNQLGTVDCEINHPVHGWIPFTCNPDDKGAQFDTAALFAEIQPHAAPYVPPPPPSPEELAAEVRAERNRLLAESDWTQLADARAAMGEAKAAEWDAYRQALRDIPEQEGFPENVVWPDKPS
jgi:hypothetical protein